MRKILSDASDGADLSSCRRNIFMLPTVDHSKFSAGNDGIEQANYIQCMGIEGSIRTFNASDGG